MDFSIDVAMPHLIFDESDFINIPTEDQDPPRHESISATTVDVDAALAFHDDDTSTVIHAASSNPAEKPPDHMELMDGASDPAAVCENRLCDSYKDLLQLSVALAEDQEEVGARMAMASQPSCKGQTGPAAPEECPINRVLKWTSRFWDILKAILQGHDGQQRSQTGNGQQQLAAAVSTWPRTRPNILILVQILTTYVSLVRLCRDIFLHLYNVLQVVPLCHLEQVLHLPSLQFGEFQMENSISFQVQALIQLNTSMLLRIEEALGTSTGTISGLSGAVADRQPQSAHTQRAGRQSIMSDPIVASLREIILSHERTRMTANSTEQPSLMTVTRNLKRILQQH